MEAILACHPASSTKCLDWVAKLCERWSMRAGPILGGDVCEHLFQIALHLKLSLSFFFSVNLPYKSCSVYYIHQRTISQSFRPTNFENRLLSSNITSSLYFQAFRLSSSLRRWVAPKSKLTSLLKLGTKCKCNFHWAPNPRVNPQLSASYWTISQ